MATITPASLASSAAQYRKDLLSMPIVSLESSLRHMTVRYGIRYSETVGEFAGNAQLGPYSASRKDSDDIEIIGRTLYTYFGSCVKEFDPNSVYSSVYGSYITRGEALKSVPITMYVLSYLMKRLGANLNKNLFSAVRSDTGTTTAALFNGFDTITASEITASKIAASAGNMYSFSDDIDSDNAVDILKAFYYQSSDELQLQETKLFVPTNVYNAYCQDYKNTTGSIVYNTDYNQAYLEGSNNLCTLVPLASKKDSPYLHLTTQGNMLVGVDQLSNSEQITVEKHAAFLLEFIATMFFGVQFESISPERLNVGVLYVAEETVSNE